MARFLGFRQLTLVLVMAGLEASSIFENLRAIVNLQSLGVPMKLCTLPGVAANIIALSLLPVLGRLNDRYATTKVGNGVILIFNVCIVFFGLACVLYGNIKRLVADCLVSQPDFGSSDYHLISYNESRVNKGSFTLEECSREHGFPGFAILVSIGYVLIETGVDTSGCFLKTFAFACIPQTNQQSIIIKGLMMFVASLGAVIVSGLGSAGIGEYLVKGKDLNANAAEAVFMSIMCGILLVIGTISTLSSGFCCPPERCEESDRSPTEDLNLIIKKEEEERVSSHRSMQVPRTVSLKLTKPTHSTKASEVEGTISNESPISASSRKVSNKYGVIGFCQRNKNQILTHLATFFLSQSIYTFMSYTANFVGVAIYRGDPLGFVGTVPYDKFIRGVEMASNGFIILFLTFTIAAISLDKSLNRFGILKVTISSTVLFSILALVLAFASQLWIFYIACGSLGVFKAVVATTPFEYVNMHAEEGKRTLASQIASVSAMFPLGFLLVSSFMGPLIDVTGNAAAPIYYSSVTSLVGAIVVAFIDVN